MAAGGGETRNTISGGFFFSYVIQGRYITVQLPLEISPALSGLPSGSPAFTGRDTGLRILLEVLAPRAGGGGELAAPSAAPAPTVAVAAVGGLPGVGKTELAIQAARAALDRGWFPGGVLFVDMFGYDPVRSLGPGQALEGFLRALAVPGEHIPPGTQDRARLYVSVLAAYAREGRRILVVIDNATTYEQVKPLLPAEPADAAIVTSRDTLALLGARLLNLDTLTPEDAAQMLNLNLRVAQPLDTRVTDHPGDTACIAQLCGGLPMALWIIAALLSENPDRPLKEMADDLDDERTRLDELSHPDASVRAAFGLSYQRLEPDPARLFRLLAINPGPEISTQATAVLADIDQTAAHRGLEALARAHLIDRGSSYGQWRMHDLLRLYAQELGDEQADADGREQALDRLLAYYASMTETANVHLTRPDVAMPDSFAGPDGTLAWLDAEQSNLVDAVRVAAATQRHQVAYRLAVALGDYLAWRSRIDDWGETADIGLNAARSLGDRHSEAWALNNRGQALQAVRRFDQAIIDHRDAAAIFHKTGERHSEGRALHNLGTALAEVRRLDEAIAAYLQDLEICRETADRQGEAVTLDSLGKARREANQLDQAIACSKDAAAIFQETGDRHGEGMALNSLAAALTVRAVTNDPGMHRDFIDVVEASAKSRELLDKAIAFAQDAVAILGETGDRYNQGMAWITLSVALYRADRFDEVISCSQHAADILGKAGERHGQGMALLNLAAGLVRVGRVDETITADQNAAAIFHQTGDRHREGETLLSLGGVLGQVQRFDEAITAYQDAAAIFHQTGDRRDEGETLFSLGGVLGHVQRLDEAITAYRGAAATFHQTGDRLDEGEALASAGGVLGQVQRLDEAITASQEAAAIFREISDLRALGRALLSLGMALRQLNRLDEAITASRDAADIFHLWNDWHREGLALSSLGIALQEAHRFDEAITAHKDAVAIFRSTDHKQAERQARDNLKRAKAARRR